MRKILLVLGLLSLGIANLPAQSKRQSTTLQRSTPEAEGVVTDSILHFLDAIDLPKHEFHSFMFLRHGKVIAEGWWKPYAPELKHTLYSVSKSFTSTAIGFAVSEGKIKVTDKVVSFFPNELPDSISTRLAQLTIKDLLTMTVGQRPDGSQASGDDWVKAGLAVPFVYDPGTSFFYNNIGPFLLSAIITKVTGEKMLDYLKPRLFEPLSITGMDWETSPMGINAGSYGLRLKTEDMAKFGQLYLQKGSWNGNQILSSSWIDEATSLKIDQPTQWATPAQTKANSDWSQGYCYLFWRCRNNAYRADGAMGQYIIVMPDQDAVIAMTSETTDLQGELNMIWQRLLPAMQNGKLPKNKTSAAALKKKLASLALDVSAPGTASALEKDISGKTFIIEKNKKQIEGMSFDFMGGNCIVKIKTDTANYDLSFGSGKWTYGETNMHHPYLAAASKGSLAGLAPFKIAGAYSWKDATTLELTLRFAESPHTLKMLCHFDGSNLTVDMTSNAEPKLVLTGAAK